MDELHTAAANESENPGLIAGIKLLPFLESLGSKETKLELETKKTEDASPSLRSLRPVRAEWMAEWMRQWGY